MTTVTKSIMRFRFALPILTRQKLWNLRKLRGLIDAFASSFQSHRLDLEILHGLVHILRGKHFEFVDGLVGLELVKQGVILTLFGILVHVEVGVHH